MIITLERKRLFCLAASYTVLVLWMILIFMMSAQTGEISGNTSGSLIENICGVFISGFEELSAAEKAEIVAGFSLPVRKAAHFTEYLVLAVLSNLAVMQSGKEIKVTPIKVGISFVIGVLYAVTDEIHQLFVPGRAGAVTDVLIDAAGVLCGCIVFLTVRSFVIKRKKPQPYSRG
ncbi:MAG: VanZ family protein [Clostridia bacterium]|nr:VanZ family protein [Clostridia bacterium]